MKGFVTKRPVTTWMAVVSVGLCVSNVPLVAGTDETDSSGVPILQRLSAADLAGPVFSHPDTQTLTESSEAGDAPASDLIWHESDDRCLQTGVYETGPNRYTISEPYPHDELMMFVVGGVTLTPSGGDPVVIVAGDTVMLPKGWTGRWDSQGYRKVYVIYDCPSE